MSDLVISPRFGRIAGIYDFLAGAVSGGAIRKAQLHNLQFVPSGSKVLVVGGGTGWIVNEIFSRTGAKHVTYLEPDAGMMKRSKGITAAHAGKITYIQATHASIPNKQYDVIITNFFLDVFRDSELAAVTQLLTDRLTVNGHWLFTDFVNDGRYNALQRTLVKTLYTFFHIVCGLTTKKLPDYTTFLEQLPIHKTHSQKFYFKMITSSIFIKTSI